MNRPANAFSLTPRTWLGWVVTVVVGFALLVAAALFVTAALIAGFLIATVLVARALWLVRKAEKARAKHFLEAEYEVERDETAPLEGRLSDRDGNGRRDR